MQVDAPIRRRRRAMAEINVVPYIDVMLVLLIIFMITAPMLDYGVEVELPRGQSEPLENLGDPLMVIVHANGDLYLNTGDGSQLVDDQTLVEQVAVIVGRNPEVQVLIFGDQSTAYGNIYETIGLLRQAGVSAIGLEGIPTEQ